MIKVVMPKLGLVMKEGQIAQWIKSEGDMVQEGEILLHIETEKLSTEYESPGSGVLHIIQPEGATIPVSEEIAVLLEDGENYAGAAAPVAGKPSTTSASGEKQGAAAAEKVQTASLSGSGKVAASPAAKRLAAEQGVDLSLVAAARTDGVVDKAAVMAYLEQAEVKATPLAKRAAEAQGVELGDVVGSGARGKVVEKDVIAAAGPAVEGADDFGRISRREKLSPLRKVMSQRMSESGRQVVPVTLTAEFDMSECTRMREKLPFKASYTAIIATAVAQALGEHPDLNASLDGEEVVYYKTVNLGIAVDTEEGLLVPSIAAAEAKNLRQIAEDLSGIAERARNRQLSLDELSRGTFSLSNLGMFGIDRFTPVVNLPEVAILGVGQMNERLVEENGDIVKKQYASFSLTFDHRLIDGATGARFLQTVREFIENPFSWVLGR